MLGLIPTITWFCRELARLHPRVEIAHVLEIAEGDVPEPLKVIVYRVLEETCRALARRPDTKIIHLSLTGDAETLTLPIGHDAGAQADAEDASLAAARERILLSGGGFEEHRDAGGWGTLRATWLR
jgi:signal transduction histidine kinase